MPIKRSQNKTQRRQDYQQKDLAQRRAERRKELLLQEWTRIQQEYKRVKAGKKAVRRVMEGEALAALGEIVDEEVKSTDEAYAVKTRLHEFPEDALHKIIKKKRELGG